MFHQQFRTEKRHHAGHNLWLILDFNPVNISTSIFYICNGKAISECHINLRRKKVQIDWPIQLVWSFDHTCRNSLESSSTWNQPSRNCYYQACVCGFAYCHSIVVVCMSHPVIKLTVYDFSFTFHLDRLYISVSFTPSLSIFFFVVSFYLMPFSISRTFTHLFMSNFRFVTYTTNKWGRETGKKEACQNARKGDSDENGQLNVRLRLM